MPWSCSMATSASYNSSSSESAGSSSLATSTNQVGQISLSSAPQPYDGLRCLGGFPQYNPQSFAPLVLLQWRDGAEVHLQGGFPASMPRHAHPMHMPMQMLWWQQMYSRHYYLQYQAAVAVSQPPSVPPSSPRSSSAHQPIQPNEAVQAPLSHNVAQSPLPENQPVNPNIQMDPQGGPGLDEGDLNHDWLEWFYTVSRAGVLLSIVYFCFSISCFIMVVGAMLLLILHQAGRFPVRPEQQNGRGRDRAAQEDAERHQGIQEMERLMDDGMEDDDDSGEEGAGVSDGQAQTAVDVAAGEPGFFITAWSFISTFFISLIPEG